LTHRTRAFRAVMGSAAGLRRIQHGLAGHVPPAVAIAQRWTLATGGLPGPLQDREALPWRRGREMSRRRQRMGFLWDLVQQSQISDQRDRSSSLEDRVAVLEGDLQETRQLVRSLIERLETNLKTDLNADEKVG